MKRRYALLAALLLICTIPALAVFNEKNLSQTLSVLRFELHQEYEKINSRQGRIGAKSVSQHKRMVSMIKKCNELSLMLYSQNQDCTLDMTYALNHVTDEYEEFNKSRLPFDEIITRLDLEIERYSRLVESLRRLPPSLRTVDSLPDSLAYHNDSIRVERRAFAGVKPSGRPQEILDSLDANGVMHTFFLDEVGQQERDSCIFYAVELLKMYSASRAEIVKDNIHYEDLSVRLKESYDYAQARYKVLQKRMFTQSQDGFFKVISSFPAYVRSAFQDASSKYSRSFDIEGRSFYSEWRGPIVSGFVLFVLLFLAAASLFGYLIVKLLARHVKLMQTEQFKAKLPLFIILSSTVMFALTITIVNAAVDHNFLKMSIWLLLVFSWMLFAVTLSLAVRVEPGQTVPSIKLYLPVVVCGLVVIALRIIFVPNKLMNLVIPLLFLAFGVWQFIANKNCMDKVQGNDKIMSIITLVVLGICLVMSWLGYVFLSMQVIIWWLFQLGCICSVVALYNALSNYEKKYVATRIRSTSSNYVDGLGVDNGRFIRITWLQDFNSMALFPIFSVLSIPFSIWLALNVFDLDGIFPVVFNHSFFNFTDSGGQEILRLTLRNLAIVVCLFFLFKYINYLIRSFYGDFKFASIRRKNGNREVRANQVNITLANNIIGILVWGTYIVTCLVFLRIPVGALSIIVAGLATGLGLAMKDILNNFIYGIQLMSGRLMVGDWVECDGIRGKVTAISYQSTQIETVDGAVMSFLNAALFSKNFKNLTRNNSYEFVKTVVGVAYGTMVSQAREVILKAIERMDNYDNSGREIVDPTRGTTVMVEELGDSSVDLAIRQYVLVSQKAMHVARLKETVYDALNAAGISIPFPQVDVHLSND